MEPMIAEVRMFAGNFAPRGWSLCEGQLLAINSNQALFSLLGTIWGGDGRTTFALPDMRGRVPIGPGNGPGLSNRRVGQKGGAETDTINVLTMPSHTHTHAMTNVSGTATATLQAGPGKSVGVANGGFIADTNAFSTSGGSGNIGGLTLNLSALNTDLTINNTGNNFDHNNMQPFISFYYIIALVGVFPSRS